MVLRAGLTLLLFRLTVLRADVIAVVAGDAIIITAVTPCATVGSVTDLTVAEDVLVVDAITCAVAGVVWIHVACATALVHADRTREVESAATGAITGAVLATTASALVGALIERVLSSGDRDAGSATVADVAEAAAIIEVGVGWDWALAEAGTVTAHALGAANGWRGEATLTATVTHTTAEAFTCALVIGVGAVADELALSNRTWRRAALAVALAARVTANAVDALTALAVSVSAATNSVVEIHAAGR